MVGELDAARAVRILVGVEKYLETVNWLEI
jgi:hypothetical protein